MTVVKLTARLQGGFEIHGTEPNSCAFVAQLEPGCMSNGIRYISDDECTESLLAFIEEHFHLKALG